MACLHHKADHGWIILKTPPKEAEERPSMSSTIRCGREKVA